MENIVFAALALGICFGVIMPVLIGFFSYKEKQLKVQREIAMHGGAEVKAELAAARDEIADLRGRMAVIERLVTDGDRRLASEIDKLAHTPRVS